MSDERRKGKCGECDFFDRRSSGVLPEGMCLLRLNSFESRRADSPCWMAESLWQELLRRFRVCEGKVR